MREQENAKKDSNAPTVMTYVNFIRTKNASMVTSAGTFI